jgi:hypothetical protein
MGYQILQKLCFSSRGELAQYDVSFRAGEGRDDREE